MTGPICQSVSVNGPSTKLLVSHWIQWLLVVSQRSVTGPSGHSLVLQVNQYLICPSSHTGTGSSGQSETLVANPCSIICPSDQSLVLRDKWFTLFREQCLVPFKGQMTCSFWGTQSTSYISHFTPIYHYGYGIPHSFITNIPHSRSCVTALTLTYN